MENIGSEIMYLGVLILGTILTFICSGLKNAITNKCDTQTKNIIAKTVVYAVEQVFKEFNGEEKLEHAIDYFETILDGYDICSDKFELRILIEAAVREMKNDNSSLLEPLLGETEEIDEDDNIKTVASVDELPEDAKPEDICLVNTDECVDVYTYNDKWEKTGSMKF